VDKRVGIVFAVLLSLNENFGQKFSGCRAVVGAGGCGGGGGVFGSVIVRFRVCGREHEEYANDNRVTALMVFARRLFFGIAAGEATGEIDDLGEGSEYLNLCNVGRLRIVVICLMYDLENWPWPDHSLPQNISLMQSSGS